MLNEIIAGNKFQSIQGITYISIDQLHDGYTLPNRPYVLVTHGGDPQVDHKYQHIADDKNLIHWFATNVSFLHQKVTAIPIGAAYSIGSKQESEIYQARGLILKRKDEIYENFTVHNHVQSRIECFKAMRRNNVLMHNRSEYWKHLQNLRSYRYCVCPIGNGIDTFRVWEALYMGCIPIMAKRMNGSDVIYQYQHEMYHHLPIEWVLNWEDFDVQNISGKVEPFDSEYADLRYWNQRIKTYTDQL